MFSKTRLFLFFLTFIASWNFVNNVSAATCNDIADGNWNSAATWSCGLVPDSDDDVVIDSHTVTIIRNETVGGVTISGGTLNMNSYTLGSYGNWTYSSGTVNTGTSTLEFKANLTFIPGSVDYYNLKVTINGADPTLTVSGDAVVKNNLIIAEMYIIDGDKIKVEGDVIVEEENNYGAWGGSVTIYINGTGNQTFSAPEDGSCPNLPKVIINKLSGNLNLSGKINLYEGWIWEAGNINAGTSTLVFKKGASFVPGPSSYYNLETNITGTTTLYITGDAIIENNLILSAWYILDSGSLKVKGDVYAEEGGFQTNASTELVFYGENDQNFYINSCKNLPRVKIDKGGGQLIFKGNSDICTRSDWTWIRGKVILGTKTLYFDQHYTSSFTPGDIKYYNIVINKSQSYYTVNLSGNLYIINELRITNGSFSNTTGNYTITTKNFVQTGGTINLGSGAMKVTGNFTRTGGTFTYGTSTVAFLGRNQVINVTGASTTFYRLYKLTNFADTLTITSGNTITIASGGVMCFWGKYEDVYSNPATLSLRSSSPGNQYNITLTGNAELEYIDVQDANFSRAITAAASVDSGNNTNLTVTKEFISTIRASGGDYTTLSTWEAAVNCDLTASSTKVFSHSGITGTMPDNSSVSGATSGATATLVHATNSQILLKNISGTFQSGEQVQIDSSNYVVISDNGYGAIATAHPYNDWPNGLEDSLTINGWTVDSTKYVNVYVLKSERHKGIAKDRNGNYTGFAMRENNIYVPLVYIEKSDIRIEGIIGENKKTNTYAGLLFGPNGNNSSIYRLRLRKLIGIMPSNNSRNMLTTGHGGIVDNSIMIGKGTETASVSFRGQNYADNVKIYSCSSYSKGTNYASGLTGSVGSLLKIKNSLAGGGGLGFTDDGNMENYQFLINYCSSLDSTSDNWGGTGNRINQTFTFVDEGNDNFHLADTDQGAKGYGTDLSIDPDFPIIDDIDGATRPVWDNWDIGADQTPRKIYRSVGPSNTSSLANGSSNSMVITSDWAIFSSDLPDNIGVGDAIQYDSDNDGNIDSIAFISERLSSTFYRVQNNLGFTPNQTTAADNDWTIYRAYTSLANAEGGNENDGIDDTVENFDDWTPGGSKDADEGGRNLVIDDVQWSIACYGDDIDTNSVTIANWTTSAQNYLKIFTPHLESEVGTSQKHTGKAETGFRHYATPIISQIGNLKIIGLEIGNISTNQPGIQILESSTTADNVEISKNIIHSITGGNQGYGIWIHGNNSPSYAYNLLITNNFIYNCSQSGIDISSDFSSGYVFNNTVFNCNTGNYSSSGGTRDSTGAIVYKNNAMFSNGESDFFGSAATQNGGSNNVSSDDTGNEDLTGFSASEQFKSVVSELEDFHLSENSQLRWMGVSLSNYFATDIDEEARLGSWDIGADEAGDPVLKTKGTLKFKGTLKLNR